jgi:hypothetical protein
MQAATEPLGFLHEHGHADIRLGEVAVAGFPCKRQVLGYVDVHPRAPTDSGPVVLCTGGDDGDALRAERAEVGIGKDSGRVGKGGVEFSLDGLCNQPCGVE